MAVLAHGLASITSGPLYTWSNLGKLGLLFLAAYVFKSIYEIFYNLFLSPLRKFPGPAFLAASPLSRAILNYRGTFDKHVLKLHEQHGDVVRIGPEELSFINAAAWKDIYGHGHAELPKWFVPGSGVDERKSIIVAPSGVHFRHRRAMLPAFSNQALGKQEEIMQQYVDLLVSKLHAVAQSSKAANIVQWYTFTAFDLVGDLSFGEKFGGLETGRSNDWIKIVNGLVKATATVRLIAYLPIVGPILMQYLKPIITKHRRAHEQRTTALMEKRIANDKMRDRGDFYDTVMRARDQEHRLTNEELAHNADLLILAGSETTATLLSGATYYLLKHPESMAQVTAEVRNAFSSSEEINFRDASARLPYMLACLNEALRIFPPAPGIFPRETLPGPNTPIGPYQVHPKTRVGVHQLSAYHCERNFHLAKEWHPERWLPEVHNDPTSPFYNDSREVHKPFSFGPRDCIGKNLAYHEMRLILAKVLFNFDLELVPGQNQWAEKQRIFTLWEKPELMIKVHERA